MNENFIIHIWLEVDIILYIMIFNFAVTNVGMRWQLLNELNITRGRCCSVVQHDNGAGPRNPETTTKSLNL